MKKHKASKAKPKKLNFKMLLAGLALFLAVGGYALYRNSVEIPSINLADGLEAEEANFLKKTVKTGTGVVKAPLVKVTVQNAAKQDVTSTIRLNPNAKVDKNATEKEVKAAVEDIKTEVLANGIATNTQTGTVEQKILNEDEKNKIIESGITVAQSLVTPTSNLQSSATCSTNGAPVTYGTWVSTGDAYGDNNEGRKCVMCGEKGYEGSMDCRDVMAQGKPIVLPTGGGLAYTGYKEEISSCIGKKDGTFINIAVGQKGDAGYCGPDGKISSEIDAKTKLNEYCAKIKTNSTWDGSKCAAKTADKPADPAKDSTTCKDPLVLTPAGCFSREYLNAQKAAKDKALATAELATINLGLKPQDYDSCMFLIKGKSYLECVNQPIGTGYYVTIKGSRLVACPMPGGKSQMIDMSKGCETISGSVAAIAAKNVKFEDGTLANGGEITREISECRFGGSPYSTGEAGISQLSICNDYTGKAPSVSSNVDSGSKATNEATNTTFIPNDAPGIVNYDTAGGVAGFVAGFTASAGVCMVPVLVGGGLGIPASFACRWEAAIAGSYGGNKLGDYIYGKTQGTTNSPANDTEQITNVPPINYVQTTGSIIDGDKCSYPGQCASGYCRPSQWFNDSECGQPPKEVYFKDQVSSKGKYTESTHCTESTQCDSGLFCMKRIFGGNTCEKLEKTILKTKDQCYALGSPDGNYKDHCGLCPNGYSDTGDPTKRLICN